ncbi:MAG: type II toxin-antitoxin system RelE/ParE family toxin [Clostridia bacterium]|nr:type II toxin-antitoxin system RelE/ParE family toxin [Clostridia bacterium]
MTREFVYTEPFRRCWKAMGLSEADLVLLEQALLEDPQMGDVIEGTGGARKMRIKLEGRGKSGGGRVIYLDVFEKEHLYLLFAYPKNVQEDLTSEQKKAIQRMIEIIRKE